MNTKAQHTPLPWHIGTNPGPIIYGPQGEQIANMLPCMLERDEHNANVKLMTASPKLLAALKELREWGVALYDQEQMPNGCLLEELLMDADKAIAEATGQE